jgi:hypothetical protein
MRELEDEIALFELRSEQLLIHLQELPRGSLDAIDARANLDTMMRRLVTLKAERDRLPNERVPPSERTGHLRRALLICNTIIGI